MSFYLNGKYLKIGICVNNSWELYPRVLIDNMQQDVTIYYDANLKYVVLNDKNNVKWFFKINYGACGPASPYNSVILDKNIGTLFIQSCDGTYQYSDDDKLLTLVHDEYYNILYLN